jgi:hypothetical protein
MKLIFEMLHAYFQPTEVKLFFVGWNEPTEIMFLLSSAFSKIKSYFG